MVTNSLRMSAGSALLALAIGAAPASAAVADLSLAELKSGSAFILIGVPIQVVGVKTGADVSSIETHVTVSVVQNIKGNPGASEIVVRTLGGAVNDESLFVSAQPRLRSGERLVLFLNQSGSFFEVFGGELGALRVSDGQVVNRGVSDTEFVDQINALP